MPASSSGLLETEVCSGRRVSSAVVDSKRNLASPGTYREVAALFSALADSTRVTIVDALSRGQLCTCELAAVTGVSESGVSQHLRILRALRLVKARRAGKFVFYTLDDAHVAALLQLALAHHDHGELVNEATSA